MNKNSLIYTGVLMALLSVVIILASQGVVQSVVTDGDIQLATSMEEYQGDEIITFNAALRFADLEQATIEEVRLVIDGPRDLSVGLPLETGEHELTEEDGADDLNPMTATVRFFDVNEEGTPVPTPTPQLFKGRGQNARIEIDVDWDPDQSFQPITGDYTANLIVQASGLTEGYESGPVTFSIVPVTLEVVAPEEVGPNETFEAIVQADRVKGMGGVSFILSFNEQALTLVNFNTQVENCLTGFNDNNPGELKAILVCSPGKTGEPLALVRLLFKAMPTAERVQTTLGLVVLGMDNFAAPLETIPASSTDHIIAIAPKCGDVDGNGSLTTADASTILQIATGLITASTTQLIVGDLNGEDGVNVIDSIILLQHAAGTRPGFDTCGPSN